MEEKHMAEPKPPPAGEPGQTPPLQPGEGGGGYMGLGEPYVDFIPTFPMVKDPATGEWRNAQPEEIPKPVNLPETGEVDQSFEVTGADNQIPPGLEDEVAALEKTRPGEVITIDLPVDQNQPADPGLPKFARDDQGQPPPGDSSEPPPPAPDPETVQALDPNLLDPLAPGPTLDTGLVGRIEGNPDLVNAVNQDSSVAEALEQDPTYLYQIEQHLGLAEQWSNDDPSFTDPSFTDPGLTEQPLPDPSTPEEGADDLTL
jgi:hypothetical protein